MSTASFVVIVVEEGNAALLLAVIEHHPHQTYTWSLSENSAMKAAVLKLLQN